MAEYWDDDWDYQICIWVQTDKSFEEFVRSVKKILDPIEFRGSKFSLGMIDCMIEKKSDLIPAFNGVPSEEYSYVIKVPIGTELIWSSFDKSFVMGLALTLKQTCRCKYLIIADDDFFVAFSGSSLPLYINKQYRPWSNELHVFLEGQKVIELSILH